MEIEIEKCAMVIIKKEKWNKGEIEQPIRKTKEHTEKREITNTWEY